MPCQGWFKSVFAKSIFTSLHLFSSSFLFYFYYFLFSKYWFLCYSVYWFPFDKFFYSMGSFSSRFNFLLPPRVTIVTRKIGVICLINSTWVVPKVDTLWMKKVGLTVIKKWDHTHSWRINIFLIYCRWHFLNFLKVNLCSISIISPFKSSTSPVCCRLREFHSKYVSACNSRLFAILNPVQPHTRAYIIRFFTRRYNEKNSTW